LMNRDRDEELNLMSNAYFSNRSISSSSCRSSCLAAFSAFCLDSDS